VKSSPWPAVPYGYDAEPKERPDVEEVEDADETTEERDERKMDGAIAVGWCGGGWVEVDRLESESLEGLVVLVVLVVCDGYCRLKCCCC